MYANGSCVLARLVVDVFFLPGFLVLSLSLQPLLLSPLQQPPPRLSTAVAAFMMVLLMVYCVWRWRRSLVADGVSMLLHLLQDGVDDGGLGDLASRGQGVGGGGGGGDGGGGNRGVVSVGQRVGVAGGVAGGVAEVAGVAEVTGVAEVVAGVTEVAGGKVLRLRGDQHEGKDGLRIKGRLGVNNAIINSLHFFGRVQDEQ